MATGFLYPARAATRRHGPQGYSSYESYRPWLRDEFAFRCVYCLMREQWGRLTGDFHLDHYSPQVLDVRQAAVYDNLLYSCATCNLAKGSQRIPDPTTALTAARVHVDDDGGVIGLTDEAQRIIRVLDLNDDEHCQWRRLWMRIIDLAQRFDRPLHQRLMGYPDDLPDLSHLRPPQGNTRPEGVEQSCFELRKRGTLGDTY